MNESFILRILAVDECKNCHVQLYMLNPGTIANRVDFYKFCEIYHGKRKWCRS